MYAAIHHTEYDITIQTQNLADSYYHPVITLQNYDTYVAEGLVFKKIQKSDFTENASLEMAVFAVESREENRFCKDLLMPPVVNIVGKTITKTENSYKVIDNITQPSPCVTC